MKTSTKTLKENYCSAAFFCTFSSTALQAAAPLGHLVAVQPPQFSTKSRCLKRKGNNALNQPWLPSKGLFTLRKWIIWKKIHPRKIVGSGDGAQQGPPGLATHSAGCCLLQLWPIPALLQLLRPGRGRQLLRHRNGGDGHGRSQAAFSHFLNFTWQSTLIF